MACKVLVVGSWKSIPKGDREAIRSAVKQTIKGQEFKWVHNNARLNPTKWLREHNNGTLMMWLPNGREFDPVGWLREHSAADLVIIYTSGLGRQRNGLINACAEKGWPVIEISMWPNRVTGTEGLSWYRVVAKGDSQALKKALQEFEERGR